MLFYQDFNEQFEGYTQPFPARSFVAKVVLSGFQWTIWRIYTTASELRQLACPLFYQDFNEQFEGYTQPHGAATSSAVCCFIRISMNNLKDIHNYEGSDWREIEVVLSGFQWTIWRIYTTSSRFFISPRALFYQDFNEQFEGYTQQPQSLIVTCQGCFIRISMNNLKDIHNACLLAHIPQSVVLSGFQWTIWRIYTTDLLLASQLDRLFYQDFNEQFEGYTQQFGQISLRLPCCFIRISMNNLSAKVQKK